MLIDEWLVIAEGPPGLSAVEADAVRQVISGAVDQLCRHVEAELGVARGAPDIRVQLI